MPLLDEFPMDKYTPICEAGSGLWGVVFFSLRKHDYDAAMATKSSNTFDDLRSKLVAVKVCPNSAIDSAEVKALHAIRDSVDGPNRNNLLSLVNHGHKWIATKAITPSLSLQELEHPIPEAFVLHSLLEMTKACHFLYESCGKPMMHGDLHPGNMLIDASSQTEFGLPGLVVIDFDQAKSVEEFEDAWVDFFTHARFLLKTLNQSSYGTPVEGWDQINDYLSSSASQSSFEGLRGAIQTKLVESLGSLEPLDVHVIGHNIRIAVAKKEAGIRLAFRKQGLMD